MAGQEGVLELGQHGVVEAEHPLHEGRPAAMRAAVLRRSSSWTGIDSHPEARSSPSVEGRSGGGSGGMVSLMGRALWRACRQPCPRCHLKRSATAGGRRKFRRNPVQVE